MKLMVVTLVSLLLLPTFALAAEESKKPAAPETAKMEKVEVPLDMTQIESKEMEAMTVFVKKVQGSYQQTPEVIKQVFAEVKALELEVIGSPFGTYYDDPNKVEEKELKWAVGVPVKGKTEKPIPAGYEFESLGPYTVATSIVTGPFENMGKAYGALYKWIGENGFVPVSATIERWLTDPNAIPKEQQKTEIMIPVKKMDKKVEEGKAEGADKPVKATKEEPPVEKK